MHQTGLFGELPGAEEWKANAMTWAREGQAAADKEATRAGQLEAIQNHLAPLLDEHVKAELAAEKTEPQMKLVYDSNWAKFTAFCAEHGLEAVPADPWVVAAFLEVNFEGFKEAERQAAAISWGHRIHGADDPCADLVVRAMLRGLRTVAKPQPAEEPAQSTAAPSPLAAIEPTETEKGNDDNGKS